MLLFIHEWRNGSEITLHEFQKRFYIDRIIGGEMVTLYVQKFNEELIWVINNGPGFFGTYFTIIMKGDNIK